MIAPLFRERGPGVVDHSRRAGVEWRDWRRDVRGLPVESRPEHPLVHPDVVAVVAGIGVLAVLPVRAPAAVGSLRQVYEALGFTGVVAVVVHADQIPVVVESELLQIAD